MTQEAPRMIRLLLVDDHGVVRFGLRALFDQTGHIHVVGDVGTAAAAVGAARRLKPDVVLMDLRLPDRSGVEACREILSSVSSTRVLFLTSYSDEEAVAATILAGAAGYLLKEISPRALVRAVETVASGVSILHPGLTGNVLRQMRVVATDAPLGKADDRERLSRQENRVLALVVEGKTNKEIAAALELSDKTVRNYLSNAFQKLNVRRRSHAATIFSRDLKRGEPT